mmetsp:Transcript_121553/g.378333  ORF Transcript_121553/g.378333 Transcript_121553/m.378333 type:complete len:136 (-) Transcript_121553:159-566(-)
MGPGAAAHGGRPPPPAPDADGLPACLHGGSGVPGGEGVLDQLMAGEAAKLVACDGVSTAGRGHGRWGGGGGRKGGVAAGGCHNPGAPSSARRSPTSPNPVGGSSSSGKPPSSGQPVDGRSSSGIVQLILQTSERP